MLDQDYFLSEFHSSMFVSITLDVGTRYRAFGTKIAISKCFDAFSSRNANELGGNKNKMNSELNDPNATNPLSYSAWEYSTSVFLSIAFSHSCSFSIFICHSLIHFDYQMMAKKKKISKWKFENGKDALSRLWNNHSCFTQNKMDDV